MTDTTDPQISRLLDAWAPPPLPAGFADRLMAQIDGGQPLPPPTVRRHRIRGLWSRTPRFVVSAVAATVMTATAAAAAGVFGEFGITIPAWQRTVERVTGIELAAPPAPAINAPTRPPTKPPSAPKPLTLEEAVADGTIASRAELDAATAAIDAQRTAGQQQRRAMAEERVDRIIADRQARGLPVPSDEERAAIRARVDERRAQREGAAAARRAERREAMGQRIDNGETIDLDRPRPPAPAADQSDPNARATESRAERRRRILDNPTPEQRDRLQRWRERRRGQSVPEQDSPAAPPEN